MVRVPLTAEQVERGRMLGNALRSARGARTMVEVASTAGVSVEALRKIETGRSPSPEFFTVVQICAALGISTEMLIANRFDGSLAAPTTLRGRNARARQASPA